MPAHVKALKVLQSYAQGESPWFLPVFCLPEFVKVVTHPRYFDPPSRLEVALDNVRNLLESPSVRLLHPGERFADLYRDLSLEAQATGQLAFDAAIVAVCLEHGVRELLTEDRDLARFRGITPRRLD